MGKRILVPNHLINSARSILKELNKATVEGRIESDSLYDLNDSDTAIVLEMIRAGIDKHAEILTKSDL